MRESRFSRALVPVCAVNVSVCDVLYNAQVCARDVFVLRVHTYMCVDG